MLLTADVVTLNISGRHRIGFFNCHIYTFPIHVNRNRNIYINISTALFLLFIILFFALAVILLSLPYRTAMMRCIARGIRFDGVKVRLEVRTFAFGGLFLSNIVLLAISLGFLMPFVQARTAKFIFSRVKLVGDVDFAAIHQSRETGPRQGEGLADAFGLSIV